MMFDFLMGYFFGFLTAIVIAISKGCNLKLFTSMLHFHRYKYYIRVRNYFGNFLGERVKETEVLKRFRICKKCGKAQILYAVWEDLNEEKKKILLEKINSGEIIEEK